MERPALVRGRKNTGAACPNSSLAPEEKHGLLADLQRLPDHEVDRDFVLETRVLRLPEENCEKQFQIFIGWARFGNLFAYDEATEKITLQ